VAWSSTDLPAKADPAEPAGEGRRADRQVRKGPNSYRGVEAAMEMAPRVAAAFRDPRERSAQMGSGVSSDLRLFRIPWRNVSVFRRTACSASFVPDAKRFAASSFSRSQ